MLWKLYAQEVHHTCKLMQGHLKCFVVVAQESTVSLVHEETEAGLEPNILLAGPPAIDTLSVTSWQTAVSHISHTATTHTHDREELPKVRRWHMHTVMLSLLCAVF